MGRSAAPSPARGGAGAPRPGPAEWAMPPAGTTTLGFLLAVMPDVTKNAMKPPTAITSRNAPIQIAPVAMLDRSWALVHWRAVFGSTAWPNWPWLLEHAASIFA
jgi:hypothetical protein